MLSLNRISRFAVGAAAVLAIATPAASARPTNLAAQHQGALFASPASDVLATVTPLRAQLHQGALGAAGAAASRDTPAVSQQLPPDRVDRIGTSSQTPIRFGHVAGQTGAGAGFDWQAAGFALATIVGTIGLAAAAMKVRGRRIAVS